MQLQQTLFTDMTVTPKLRLAEVETELKRTRAFGKTPPSRQALINWLQEGRLQGVLVPGLGWLVFESSYQQFVKSFEPEVAA